MDKIIKRMIILLIIGISQAIFFLSVQSHPIWEYVGDYMEYNGQTTCTVTPNPLGGNKYVIKATGYYATVGNEDWGNITFTNLEINQTFFFEYHLGVGPFIGEDIDSELWIMPSGTYNVTWYDTDWGRHYNLIAASFLYPIDLIVLVVSGFIALFTVVGTLRVIITRSRKKKII